MNDGGLIAFANALRRNTDAPHPDETEAERHSRDRLTEYARDAIECIKRQVARVVTGEIDNAEALANVRSWAERNAPR